MSEAAYAPRDGKRLIESPGPGYLAWADSYYLGWRAYVDSRRAEVLKANQAYRAALKRVGGIAVPGSIRSLPLGLF